MKEIVDQFGNTLLTIVQAVFLIGVLMLIFGRTAAGEFVSGLLIKQPVDKQVGYEEIQIEERLEPAKTISGRDEPVLYSKGLHSDTSMLSMNQEYSIDDLVYCVDADGTYFDSVGNQYDTEDMTTVTSTVNTSYIHVLGIYDTDSNAIIYDTFNTNKTSTIGDYLDVYDATANTLSGYLKNPLYTGLDDSDEYNLVVTYHRSTNTITFNRAGAYQLKIKSVDKMGKETVNYIHVAVQTY